MSERLRFVIVDDDPGSASAAKALLEGRGHDASIFFDPEEALASIPIDPPDCVLLDILMPGLDGLEVCSRLKEMPKLSGMKVVMCTAKAFDSDRRRAIEIGADGYIVKPIRKDSFFETLDRVMANELEFTFWGIRGTVPRPGRETLRYGGNTSCVSMEFPRGQLFAFDAGSGLKVLGDSLVKRGERLTGKLFLSHPHWDHINTLPFFAPFYVQGNEWEILGSPHGSVTVKDLVNAQMDGVFFPVTTREFGAKLEFRDLREGTYDFDEISVSTMLLAHPGNCLGYRVSMDGRSVCYITDNELSSPTSDNHTVEYEERLLEFVRGTDALIIDTNYLDEEYESKVGWGHSSVTQVANFAHRAEVKTLYPFHHDYAHDDDTIDRKLEQMQEILKTSDTEVVQPVEGDSFRL